jgi:DNA-binding HxlR family transcriptional regulator
MDYLADCRARLAFDLLAHTWSSVVLWALRHGPQRPVTLRKRIGGISAKALNETLRRLEHNGLVERQGYREAPPRVEYRLTELGTSLLGPLETLGDWANVHGDAVMAAQEPNGDGARLPR